MVHVIAFDRPASLTRTLEALARASYDGARVDLVVAVDGARGLGTEREALARETAAAARGFDWAHGSSKVVARDRNVGATTNRFEAWTPRCAADVGAFFEDDARRRRVASPLPRDQSLQTRGVRARARKRERESSPQARDAPSFEARR